MVFKQNADGKWVQVRPYFFFRARWACVGWSVKFCRLQNGLVAANGAESLIDIVRRYGRPWPVLCVVVSRKLTLSAHFCV